MLEVELQFDDPTMAPERTIMQFPPIPGDTVVYRDKVWTVVSRTWCEPFDHLSPWTLMLDVAPAETVDD